MVILFSVTFGSAGTNLAILPYLALSLWCNRTDIPFETLCTRLPPRQGEWLSLHSPFPVITRSLVEIGFLHGTISLSSSLTFPWVSVSSYLSPHPAAPFERLLRDNTSMSNTVRSAAGNVSYYTNEDETSLVSKVQGEASATFKYTCARLYVRCFHDDGVHESLCNKFRHFPM